jgi:hypothetical protein
MRASTTTRYNDNVTVYGYAGDNPQTDIVLTAGEGVRMYVAAEAFRDNDKIRSVTLKGLGGEITVDSSAFEGCHQLENVQLFGDVYLKNAAFANCVALTSVLLDHSDPNIGDRTFENCFSLSELILLSEKVSLSAACFKNCVSLEQIQLQDLQTIGSKAFQGCVNLRSIMVGDQLRSVGNDAFASCVSMEAVHYGGTITQWVNNISFWNEKASPFDANGYCKLYIDGVAVQHIVIGEPIERVRDYCFYNYRNALSVDLANNVTVIGTRAFYKCENLETVGAYDSLEGIASEAFAYCLSLQNVPLGQKMTRINDEAFKECRSVERVYIPGTVTSLGENVFGGCTGMESIELEDIWRKKVRRALGEDIDPEVVFFSEEE